MEAQTVIFTGLVEVADDEFGYRVCPVELGAEQIVHPVQIAGIVHVAVGVQQGLGHIPAAYPAVASPVKIGYTPGVLYAGTVYQLGSKYYLSLCNGVYGYFVEVADQG